MTAGPHRETESEIPAWLHPEAPGRPDTTARGEPRAGAAGVGAGRTEWVGHEEWAGEEQWTGQEQWTGGEQWPGDAQRTGEELPATHDGYGEGTPAPDGWDDGSGHVPAAGQGPHAAGRPARTRRPARWGHRLALGGVALVLALVVLAVGGVIWVNGHLDGAGGAPLNVTLPDQLGHAALASTLARDGAVSDAWLFRRYLDYRNYPAVQGGSYTLHRHEGYRAALHDLGNGPHIVQTRLTIPEGYGIQQIAAAVGSLPGLSAQRFLTLAGSGAVRSQFEPAGSTNLEGLLFPDTYFVTSTETEQDVLQAMVTRFDQIATDTNLAASATANGLTPYQTLIVASLVEREAKVPQDRPKIARVILNRLAAHMKLQIDATVEYAEGVHKTKLLDSDLRTPSPYNTYLIAGLPPGPIASPGRASIEAVLSPTPGTWRYYVLINPDGEHGFATTQAEFARLLAEARAKGLWNAAA